MEEDRHIIKSHNENLLLYHFVCPAKYRRKVFTKPVEKILKVVCEEIGKRYEKYMVEIGSDEDHIHFLLQSVLTYSPTKIIRTVKSITAKKIFKTHPEVKKLLWGGSFGQVDIMSIQLVNTLTLKRFKSMSKTKEKIINKFIVVSLS